MRKLFRGIATAGGIGLLPLAPGTWAAAATAILWYTLNISGMPALAGITISAVVSLIGIVAGNAVIKDWGKDPSKVVIDEVAGMSIALITIPHHWKAYVSAFILFRFFDIAKPLGIRQAEKAGGGFGIMLDDIFAGIYSLIVLKLLIIAGII